MRTLLRKIALATLLIVALSGFSLAQDTAKTDLKKAGSDTKAAGKATGNAAKNTGKAAAKGTKKGVNKVAGATQKAGSKVKEKTEPN